jgi:hypothetical protein
VHLDLADAVDSMLRGYPLPPDIRSRDESGEIRIEKSPPAPRPPGGQAGFRRQTNGSAREGAPAAEGRFRTAETGYAGSAAHAGSPTSAGGAREESARGAVQPVRIYPYGVARNRLYQAAKRLGVPVIVVNGVGETDILVTLRSYYRKRQRPIQDAENRGMSIYVLRANTINQMQHFLSDLFNLEEPSEDREVEPLLESTQAAIEAVLNGERWVELPPASSYVRRLQHQMARKANLTSHSYGKEPHRRVRIFRE